MREFFVSYKLKVAGKAGIFQVEGDCIASMPDDGLLDAAWIQSVKRDVKQGIIAKLAAEGSLPMDSGDLIVVALVPLERAQQDAQEAQGDTAGGQPVS